MNKKQPIHKLKKSSAYSYSVTIPKELVDKYGWKEKQKLSIKDKGHGKIEILSVQRDDDDWCGNENHPKGRGHECQEQNKKK